MDKSREEGDLKVPKKSQAEFVKAKSCKGHLFYSSALKSQAREPRCFGISQTISEQVPRNMVQQKLIKSAKDGQKLADFSYSCLGYSLYFDEMGEIAEECLKSEQGAKEELPMCSGLKVLIGRKAPSKEPSSAPAPAPAHAPAHAQNKEDSPEIPLPQRHKPAPSVGDDFLRRFTKNANLVASGVARNMLRVGNYIKESVDDLLHPHRRRPK